MEIFSLAPLPNGYADRVNARPLFFSRKPADIDGREIPSGFDAAVLSIEGVENVEAPIGGLLEEKGAVSVAPSNASFINSGMAVISF